MCQDRPGQERAAAAEEAAFLWGGKWQTLHRSQRTPGSPEHGFKPSEAAFPLKEPGWVPANERWLEPHSNANLGLSFLQITFFFFLLLKANPGRLVVAA